MRILLLRDLLDGTLQRVEIALPLEFHVARLDPGDQRVRRNSSKASRCGCCLWPASQRAVGEQKVPNDVRILRIEPFHSLVNGDRFLPPSLPAPNRGDISADIAIVR